MPREAEVRGREEPGVRPGSSLRAAKDRGKYAESLSPARQDIVLAYQCVPSARTEKRGARRSRPCADRPANEVRWQRAVWGFPTGVMPRSLARHSAVAPTTPVGPASHRGGPAALSAAHPGRGSKFLDRDASEHLFGWRPISSQDDVRVSRRPRPVAGTRSAPRMRPGARIARRPRPSVRSAPSRSARAGSPARR
jgi:hypothetical protein